MPTTSPTVRRRELAARLRQLRAESGLTVEQVAERLLCSAAKVSRMETAARGVQPRDIRDLCDLYGVTDAIRTSLMGLARQAKQQGWWQQHSDLSSEYSTYIGLEDSATRLRQFEALRVPGLLQTAEYTRALIRGLTPSVDDASLDDSVGVRAERQRLLAGPSAPQLWFVIDEAALRREVGSPQTMAGQAQRLLEAGSGPGVTVQVIPYSAGAHPGQDGAFTILEFAEEIVGDVIYVEGLLGNIFLDRESDVQRYNDTFETLGRVAAGAEASAEILSGIASDWRSRRNPAA